jgi:hypothetical protein
MKLATMILAATLASTPSLGLAAVHHTGPHLPPPPVRVEVMPPRVGHAWVPGHYDWRHDQYVWVGGHYRRERVGWAWHDGAWVRHGDHYDWHAGHWSHR